MMGVANLDRLRRRRDSWRKARGRLFEQKVEMRDLTGPKRINGIGRASYVCLLALNFTDQQGATDQRFLV